MAPSRVDKAIKNFYEALWLWPWVIVSLVTGPGAIVAFFLILVINIVAFVAMAIALEQDRKNDLSPQGQR